MDFHRVWRLTLALGGVFALVCAAGNVDPVVAGAEFAFDAPAEESSLTTRPSPFYEPEASDVAPLVIPAERIPTRSSVISPQSSTIKGPAQKVEQPPPAKATHREKTPLPESEFAESLETSSVSRGRSSFGPSVAWAAGILAVGWIARQLLKSTGGGTRGAMSSLELLSRQSIGPQQQLTLVRLGQRILLVGTTPNGMSTLATVDDPGEVQAIVAEHRPVPSQVGPTVLDLLRGRRSEPLRPSAVDAVSVSTSQRSSDAPRRSSSSVNREVADV